MGVSLGAFNNRKPAEVPQACDVKMETLLALGRHAFFLLLRTALFPSSRFFLTHGLVFRHVLPASDCLDFFHPRGSVSARPSGG